VSERVPPTSELSHTPGATPDLPSSGRQRLSVVSCAYNEEANIGRFLRGCQEAENGAFDLLEIIVVASGCTDRTVPIVQEFAAHDPRIRLFTEATRTGKAAAMALGLRQVQGDLVLIAGSDTSPSAEALREVVRPFSDPTVSLVCTRPTPMNTTDNFVVRVARTMWDIHHVVSSRIPKAGEAFAIRNRNLEIPKDVQDDDTYIGAVSVAPGSKAVYADKAVFYNRVPTTAPDFLRQRWRINRQELGLERAHGIQVSTWQPQVMLGAMGEFLREKPRSIPYVVTLAGAEIVVRLGALVTTAFVKQPMVQWTPIRSTKEGVESPSQSPRSPV